MEASIRIQDVDTSNVCIGDSPAPQIASERLVPRTKSSISKVRNLHGELPQHQRRPTLYPIPPASALRRLKYCSVRPPKSPDLAYQSSPCIQSFFSGSRLRISRRLAVVRFVRQSRAREHGTHRRSALVDASFLRLLLSEWRHGPHSLSPMGFPKVRTLQLLTQSHRWSGLGAGSADSPLKLVLCFLSWLIPHRLSDLAVPTMRAGSGQQTSQHDVLWAGLTRLSASRARRGTITNQGPS